MVNKRHVILFPTACGLFIRLDDNESQVKSGVVAMMKDSTATAVFVLIGDSLAYTISLSYMS